MPAAVGKRLTADRLNVEPTHQQPQGMQSGFAAAGGANSVECAPSRQSGSLQLAGLKVNEAQPQQEGTCISQETTPLKLLALVAMGDCTIRHHRTSVIHGHYFEDQEMCMIYLKHGLKHRELDKVKRKRNGSQMKEQENNQSKRVK